MAKKAVKPKAKPDDTEKMEEIVYMPARRKIATFVYLRRGPTPIEDDNHGKRSERPGLLAVGSSSEKTAEESTKMGYAGSLELLAYFFRLSKEEHKDEIIDTAYINALIRSGAKINFVDKYGQSALHAAARDWNTDVAQYLIDQGADVNKPDLYGRTPIFVATILDYPEMIEFLAKKGANIHAETYGEKQTPLHYAARSNAIESMKALLKLGAHTSAEDFKGRCPLYTAAEQGSAEAVQYLLDIGCPAAVYDSRGYSAMALLVEKMPNVASQALSQFLDVNQMAETKSYYLLPLECNPNDPNQDKEIKTTLQMIVKYGEMELLQHPVIDRLLQLKVKQAGKLHLVNYLVLNIVYLILWTILAYVHSLEKEPFRWNNKNIWKIVVAFLALALTLASAVEQILLARNIQRSENTWKSSRIKSLREDLRYCHPQWPNEREAVEVQIESYSSLVGDYYKNAWTYLEWAICASAVGWNIACGVNSFYPTLPSIQTALRVLATIVIFLIWLRFLKVCRIFRLAGQYIAIFGNILYALGQFAFLFFLFFIPFVVAFWVFFGGKEHGKKIEAKYKTLGKAFENLNDVVYTVWTLTVVIGFPMVALMEIDKRIAEAFVSIYYLVMSIVLLNLFIALMSNLFARVHKDAEKYGLLEQAKIILLAEAFLKKGTKKSIFKYMQKHCNPLTESLQFRESIEEPVLVENVLQRIKQNAKILVGNLLNKTTAKSDFNRAATINQIKHNIQMMEISVYSMEAIVTSLQKFKVMNKKVLRLLGVQEKKPKK